MRTVITSAPSGIDGGCASCNTVSAVCHAPDLGPVSLPCTIASWFDAIPLPPLMNGGVEHRLDPGQREGVAPNRAPATSGAAEGIRRPPRQVALYDSSAVAIRHLRPD